MPFAINIDHDGVSSTQVPSKVTDDDLLQTEKRLRKTPEFTAGYRLLQDCQASQISV
jgi:hypothetical protein